MVQSRPGSAGVVQVWQRLTSRIVHHSQWFDVREDEVVQPDGARAKYVHVVAPPSVTVLAIQDDEHVVLTRQWIYTHGGTEWRLPGGAVDETDVSPMAAARRELAEETGLRAAEWEQIGEIHGADSLSNHVDHIFLASDLNQGPTARGPGEADMRVWPIPLQQAIELVHHGRIPHAGSAHALLTMALRRATADAGERMMLATR